MEKEDIWKIYIGLDGWLSIINKKSNNWIAMPMEEFRRRKDSIAVKIVLEKDTEVIKNLKDKLVSIAKGESSLGDMPSSEGSEGQASGFPKAEEPRDEGL